MTYTEFRLTGGCSLDVSALRPRFSQHLSRGARGVTDFLEWPLLDDYSKLRIIHETVTCFRN